MLGGLSGCCAGFFANTFDVSFNLNRKWRKKVFLYQTRLTFLRWWKRGNNFKVSDKCLLIRLIRQSSSFSFFFAFEINNSVQIFFDSLRTLSTTLISPASRVDVCWAKEYKRFNLSLSCSVNPFTQPPALCHLSYSHSLISHARSRNHYLRHNQNLHHQFIKLFTFISPLTLFPSEIRWIDERRACEA